MPDFMTVNRYMSQKSLKSINRKNQFLKQKRHILSSFRNYISNHQFMKKTKTKTHTYEKKHVITHYLAVYWFYQ